MTIALVLAVLIPCAAVVVILAGSVVAAISALNQRDRNTGEILNAVLAEMHRDRLLFASLASEVFARAEGDRAERRTLLNAVLGRNVSEFAAAERATTVAAEIADVRRPWSQQDFERRVTDLLEAHEGQDRVTAAERIPEGLGG